MSAAEKLKVLNRRLAPVPWISVDASYADEFPDEGNLVDLRNALPQIVAVIEAAEEVAERVPAIARPLTAALAALDEVLT